MMPVKYTYFIIENKQEFVSANSLEIMTDFLNLRILMQNEKDDEASAILQKYLKLEYPEAFYLDGFLYSTKEKLSEEERAAFHFEAIKKAAEGGYPTAMYRHGAYLDMGDHWEVNKKLASQYFEMAAETGHAQSEWIHGIECFYGEGQQPHDEVRGMEFIERSARKKFVYALNFLEKFYSEDKPDLKKVEFFLSYQNDDDIIGTE